MEAVLNLMRPSTVSYDQYIICQQVKKDTVFASCDEGLATKQETTNARQKLSNFQNRIASDWILTVLHSECNQTLLWHKNSYVIYTDKDKISRGHKSIAPTSSTSKVKGEQQTQSCVAINKNPRVLWSKDPPVNWSLCIFCPYENSKENLSSVTTFKISKQILDAGEYEHELSVCVVEVSDLIASKRKYHPNRYTFLEKNNKK